nr:hypothetical protein BaRGS_033057 [Batillaria attramentaria]
MRSRVRVEDIATMHKTVLDQSPQQAIMSFINVMRGWDLFGATIFPVCRILSSFSYSDIVHTSPAIKSIMIVIGNMAKGTKFMFNSNEIAHLVRDYMVDLQARYMLAPSESSQRMSRAFDLEEMERQNATIQRLDPIRQE